MGDDMGHGAEPGPLERLGPFQLPPELQRAIEESARNRAMNAELDQANAKGLASVYASTVLPEYLKNHPDAKSWDYNKLLPQDPRVLKMMLDDPTLSAAAKEKVLEVALLRGGSKPIDEYTPWELAKQLKETGVTSPGDVGDYKTMARDVLLEMKDPQRAELLTELSKSLDHLPEDRKPATQLAYILLQPGGGYDTAESRQKVVDAIKSLPAETQGRMLYAVDNAAGLYDKGLGQEPRVSGGSISLPGGAGGMGVSTTLPPDPAFVKASEHVHDALGTELKDPVKRDQISQGYWDATPPELKKRPE